MDTKKTKTKDVQYYLNLPWAFILESSKDNENNPIFVIRVNELPGVVSDGYTIEEAYQSIKEAMALAFQMYLEDGEEIPEPINEDQYKGNITYRTSPLRHYLIAKEAKKKNLSLSQVIDNYIDTVSVVLRK